MQVPAKGLGIMAGGFALGVAGSLWLAASKRRLKQLKEKNKRDEKVTQVFFRGVGVGYFSKKCTRRR